MQLYLCGLSAKKLDKLRRLVNAAGGLHFNQPSEELTHVVMGELDQDLKNFLSKATHRSELSTADSCRSASSQSGEPPTADVCFLSDLTW